MKYEFKNNPGKKGYIVVFDTELKQPMCEMIEQHALVIVLMYNNLHQQSPRMANEFMYGHIMGMTLTLMYADHYPTIKLKEMQGETMVSIRDPVSGDTRLRKVMEVAAEGGTLKEMADKLKGPQA